MGLYCEINLESDWGFPNRTPELGLPIDYTQAIGVFSDTFMKISQELVPVDTGYLKSTLKSSGSGMMIEAEATADYAEYVEYGTWRCRAQPYFYPAVESATNASFGVAKKIYDEAITREAELVKQQYIAEAQSRVAAAASSVEAFMGGIGSMIAMSIIAAIVALFQAFFSSIFGNNEE